MPTPPRPARAAQRATPVRTVLAWCRATLFPLFLFAAANVPLFAPGLLLGLVFAALFLPTGLLRRRPLPALLFMLLGLAAVTLGRSKALYVGEIQIIAMISICVAVGYVAAIWPRRISVSAAILALASGTALTFADQFNNDPNTFVLLEVLAVVTSWVIGNSVRQRRQYAIAQREQAEARAVQAERLRIARELHDMIAHSIGIIAIQAGVGRRVIDTQPAEARNALAAVEETSRDTLAALRRMLGTLRRSDPESGAAALDPAPGLAELGNLVARTRDAGVRVEVRWRGDRRPLPPDIDLSAFRLIQEAVTNVIRHSGTGCCDVLVGQEPDELTIEITDDGRGGGTAVAPGHGITGMRERVGLLDGEFTAGPRPEGGFRVAARIPVPAGTS